MLNFQQKYDFYIPIFKKIFIQGEGIGARLASKDKHSFHRHLFYGAMDSPYYRTIPGGVLVRFEKNRKFVRTASTHKFSLLLRNLLQHL